MLQLFGCGIFPHTGSHQSRLTGHWLHSITERPGLEKKKNTHKRQMSSLKPCTTTLPHHSTLHPTKKLQFPLLPGMNKSVQLQLYSGEPLIYSFREQHYTTCKKAKPIPSKLTGSHNRLTNHWRICLPTYSTGLSVWHP